MGYTRAILIVKDVTVKLFRADEKLVGELPHITFEVVMNVPLSVPNGATQRLPINPIIKPSDRSINSCIERLNGVKESAADVGDVSAVERKTVTMFVSVGVLKVEENGQFEQNAGLVNNSFAKLSFDNGVGRGEGVGVMVRPAKHTGGMAPLTLVMKVSSRPLLP